VGRTAAVVTSNTPRQGSTARSVEPPVAGRRERTSPSTTSNGSASGSGGPPRRAPRVFADNEEAIQTANPPRDGGLELIFAEGFADGWDGANPIPSEIVDEVLYEGLVHWLAGHFGSGKTTLAAHWSYMAMLDERHVFWLDWEVSEPQARARLRDAGVPKDLARRLFHFAERPLLPTKTEAVDAMLGRLSDRAGGPEKLACAVVVIDSYTKALTRTGADENENAAASAWTEAVVIGLKRRGATVVVIDHPTKDQKASNPYVGRGAGAKADDADLAYFTVAEEPFKRDRIGKVRVVCHKDRESVIGTGGLWRPSKDSDLGEQWFQVGDAQGGLPVLPIEQPDPVKDDGGVPKVERMVNAMAGAMRLAPGELRTQELAKAAGTDAQDTLFKGKENPKGALHLAMERGILGRVKNGTYAPGATLADEAVEPAI
jgi:hypothetical protein